MKVKSWTDSNLDTERRKRRSEWKSSYACNGLVVFIPFTRLNRMQRFVTRRLVTAFADGWTFVWPRKEWTMGPNLFRKRHILILKFLNSLVNSGKFKKILLKSQNDKNSNANSKEIWLRSGQSKAMWFDIA